MARLVPLSLAGLAVIAAAQERSSNSISELPICQSMGNASRTREACEHEPISITRSEQEVTFTDTFSVELPARRAECQATVTTLYFQSDTLADVEGTVQVEGCGAATGEYSISARVRDENGETKTLEFNAAWQRDDDRPVRFEANYPIGENVELLSLRARGVRCDCADQVPESPDATAP